MAKGVVITTVDDATTRHLRKVNVVTAAVTGTSWSEWTSVTDDGHNTFETVVKVSPAVAGLKTVIVPNDVPPGYRYWRLSFSTTNTPVNSTNYAEIELRAAAAGADQTSPGGGSITTSGNLSGTGAELVDDNTATNWHSATSVNPALWRYDFGVGVTKAIIQIAVTANNSNAGYSTDQITVQRSSDDSNWTTEWVINTALAWSTGETRVFTKP